MGYTEVKWTKGKRLDNLISQLSKVHKQEVEYGYFAEQGNHPESPNVTYAQLMAIHELRPPGDPLKRDVLGTSWRWNGYEFIDFAEKQMVNYIEKSAINRKPSPKTMLDRIGRKGIEITRPTFGDVSMLKPNTAATAKRKGKNSPMVEWGFLRDALSFKSSLRKSLGK